MDIKFYNKEEKKEIIKEFLEGSDDQKYITGIEGDYYSNQVTLMIEDPEKGKYTETHSFTPYIFVKDFKKLKKKLYNSNKDDLKSAMDYHGIEIKPLRTDSHPRLEYGYKYLIKTTKQQENINQFFSKSGYDIYKRDDDNLFVRNSGPEQFLIQTGKRLFKGYESYNDVHKFYFDIETTGLNPKDNFTFLIGMKDNRGFRKVLTIDLDNPIESEKQMTIDFFQTIQDLKPTIIGGYFSETFDFFFLLERAKILGIELGDRKDEDNNRIYDVLTSLNHKYPLKRKAATFKHGSETEHYEQTIMWGINIIDISHAVKKAAAINSDIKGVGLKYICKYSEIAKENRMYVKDGNTIYKIWEANKWYMINKKDNSYKIIHENHQSKPQEYKEKLKKWVIRGREEDEVNSLKRTSEFFDGDPDNVDIICGKDIIYEYLLDDLTETEMVDNRFNEAAFMIGKIAPTAYVRATTMGNASLWRLLMTTYSFHNNLAIPCTDVKRDIVGGLSRMLKCGFAKNVIKFDYNALYPNIELTHGVFPDSDITGVTEAILEYFKDARTEFKGLAKHYKQLLDFILEKLYDTKQLPIKILSNSCFGAIGSPAIYNWGDNNTAERITCTGRQYLRLMTKHFMDRNFKPLVCDSVTYDTPIYLKNNKNELEILPICDLFNENSKFLDEEKLRDFEKKEYQVLTRNGWKNIKYIYRHETNKKIHRIVTKNRLVNVTEDHSLFQNGIEIKPSSLVKGDKIDIYKIESFNKNEEITEDQAWLYGFFLGDGSSNNSPRKSSYKSRITGIKSNSKGGFRNDWKISNTRIPFLDKLKNILEKEFKITGLIKDHMKSSGVYNLVVHNKAFADLFCSEFYTSYREKKVPSFILNSTNEIKKAFIEGVCASDGYGDTIETCSAIGMKSQIAMSGLAYLFNELNIEYKIQTRKDKESFISFILQSRFKGGSVRPFKDFSNKKDNEVWTNLNISNKNGYVYDISTEDGTFIGGIGGVILHNTDGENYSMPDNINEIKYINKKGEELVGHEAVLGEFNEKYMKGTMRLEEDGIVKATINFSRKNYANLYEDGKVKLTGASIKSKTIQTYIEEFFDKAIKMLLVDGNAKRFVDEYYEYLTLIYNKQIPLAKIANKKKVKEKVSDYIWAMENTTQKNGRKPAKKAHMELMIEMNLNPDLGEVILFINNGKVASHGDTGHSYVINLIDLEQDPDKLGEYNVPRYISNFNKKLKPLLVCLSPDVRKTLLVKNPKDRQFYTDIQLELVNGIPMDIEQQDFLFAEEYLPGHKNEPLFEMSLNEIKYWNKSGLDPREIFDGFTTGLSDIRLLTQEEQKIKKEEELIIKDWFKIKNITIKNEMEFLLHKDEVIMYKTYFTTYVPNLDKETKKNKPWIESKVKLADFKWILSKYEIIEVYKKADEDSEEEVIRREGRFNDLEILEEEIYKNQFLLETA